MRLCKLHVQRWKLRQKWSNGRWPLARNGMCCTEASRFMGYVRKNIMRAPFWSRSGIFSDHLLPCWGTAEFVRDCLTLWSLVDDGQRTGQYNTTSGQGWSPPVLLLPRSRPLQQLSFLAGPGEWKVQNVTTVITKGNCCRLFWETVSDDSWALIRKMGVWSVCMVQVIRKTMNRQRVLQEPFFRD